MVMGASFEPSTGSAPTLTRACAGPCGCCGCDGCCFSSSCRIWRSSWSISSACSRVMPASFLFCAARGSSSASGSAAHFVNPKNFVIRSLILFEHQHVLAVLDGFVLRDQVEMVGLDFLDDVRHVEPDVRHGAAGRHGLGPLVILHYY